MNNKMVNKLFFSWDYPDNYSLIIEEDDKSAYAYLCQTQPTMIISKVWLYNRAKSPDKPFWMENPKAGPFMNPLSYIYENQEIPINPAKQFEANFVWTPDKIFQIEIGLRSIDDYSYLTLLAVLRADNKTGWCRNAKVDNLIALNLSEAIYYGLYISTIWS